MAREGPTPEEQLLDLIEKEGGPEAAKLKRKKRPSAGLAGLKNLPLALEKGFRQVLARSKKGLREPNLKVLNKIFLALSILLLGYSIVDFVFARPDIKEVYARDWPVKKKRPQGETMAEERPFLHYLEMVRRRNIFSPIKLKEVEKPELKKQRLEEMAKNLSLVGISWGPEPLAMIEDKQGQKTYFLKKGEMINKFKIDDISKDKVTLSFEGQSLELM